MDNYVKQHIFDDSNIGLFFLSPYTEVRMIGDEIIFMRQNSEMAVVLPFKGDNSMKFVEMLKNGINEEELKSVLSDLIGKNGEDWLYSCMWEGIIE